MVRTKTIPHDFLVGLDRLPVREDILEKFRKALDNLAEFYGFEKIATSPVEDVSYLTPLLRAGIFSEKSLVFCKTKTGLDVLLRPAGVVAVLRAFHQHKLNDLPQPLKLSFTGDRFFIDPSSSPQRIVGRPEWGLVVIGEETSVAEVETLQIIWKAISEFMPNLPGVTLRVNADGCSVCRPAFRAALASYFRGRVARLCRNCKRCLKKFPTRILACLDEKCLTAASRSPQVLDFLCEQCKKHLRGFLEFLDEIRIPYSLDRKFFRDTSCFSTLVFDLVWSKKAPEDTENSPSLVIGSGGRMSRVGELVTGKKLDVAGATVFLDNLESVLARSGKVLTGLQGPQVFLVQLGELAKRKSLHVLEALRQGGITARESLGRDSIKSQLRLAERLGVSIALILGQKEVLDSTVIVRETDSGMQEIIPQEKLVEFLKTKIKK